jgi:hypothetical protein
MRGNVLHLLWFTIVSCAIASIVLIGVGKMVYANAAGENDPTVVRDELGLGSHHLYGMVMVSQTCDELQDHIQLVSSTTYEVVFDTWQEPSVPCLNQRTPRVFHESIFAPPTGVEFVATLDGAVLPIAIVPVVSASSSLSSP